MFLFLYLARSYVVKPNDLLMSSQAKGEPRINRSCDGNKMRIGNIEYTNGLGVHATCMTPIDVPNDATRFRGIVGVDYEAKGEGNIVFQVLSGSEVLWTSETMTRSKGPAYFDIKLPVGATKLYLFADQVIGSDDNDHADWANLLWVYGGNKEQPKSKFVDATMFGVKSGVHEDQGPALRKAISEVRTSPRSVLFLPKGEYHFYAEGALKMRFHVTNHDQPLYHPVAIPLIDLQETIVDFSGSTLYFHGLLIPVTVMDSVKLEFNNVHIDYERMFYSEGTVTSIGSKTTGIYIDQTKFPFRIENDNFVFVGEGWTQPGSSIIAFEKGTKHIIAGTADIGWSGKVTDLGGGNVNIEFDTSKDGYQVGDIFCFRAWTRPHPASFIYRSKDTVFNKVSIHSSCGMGLVGQRSENIHLNGGGIYLPEGSGRAHSTSADATHFSSNKGKIIAENGFYEGMMDDAINIHSICLQIQEVINKTGIRVKYMHGQAVGFETFLPGETMRFIHGPTLQLDEENATVVSVRRLSTEELEIVIDRALPSTIGKGDAIENGDYYPEVEFRNNFVQNNRARGSLFTAPKRIVIENNTFSHVAGSAILLAGDAMGWFESGECLDVVMRKNRFIDCLTSIFQFTEAIISIYPSINDIPGQTQYYHRNVVIEDNYFESFDVPLLYAISTKNLAFEKNEIKYNDHYKPWGKKPFILNKCANVTVAGNNVEPEKKWTIDDFQYQNMDAAEIHIQ